MSRVKIIKISDYKKDIRGIFSDLNFKINPGEKVLIKPNLVMPREADSGVTTNLELIAALVEILKDNQAIPILAEGVGYEFDSQTFSILGIDQLAKNYNIQFIDCRNCQTFSKKVNGRIFKKIELPKILEEVDKIINVPKLKTHVLTGISCGMKNLIGLLPLSERRRMHLSGLSKSIVELNLIIPTDLTIVDASVIMSGQGPAFGDTVKLGYILAGTNVFATDFRAAQFLNIDPLEIGHLRVAKQQNLIQVDFNKRPSIKDFSVTIPKNRFYIFLYWLVYLFDFYQEKVTQKTLIPWLQWNFGSRPKLDVKKCHLFPECKECIKLCPIGAIDKKKGIDLERCVKIRCLKCFEVCPHKAITIKGISKPSR